MRRVFVALAPPVPTAEALRTAAAGALESQVDAWRLPAARHLHLTLAFLGDIPEKRLDDLAQVVGEAAAACPAPSLRIRGVGAFPGWERARILWAGLSEGEGTEGRLPELQETVAEALRRARFRFDDKGRYVPHLTVARPKKARPKGAGTPVPEAFRALGLDLAWEPDAVLCVESRLGAASAERYPVLSRHPLPRN